MKHQKFMLTPNIIQYLKKAKDLSSLLIHYFTQYRFNYYLKKEKLEVAKFREKDLDLQWLALYMVDLLSKSTIARDQELLEMYAKGKGKESMVHTLIQ